MCVDVTTGSTRTSGDATIICVRCRSVEQTENASASSTKNLFDRLSSSVDCMGIAADYFLRVLDLYSPGNGPTSPEIVTADGFPRAVISTALCKFYTRDLYGSSKRCCRGWKEMYEWFQGIYEQSTKRETFDMTFYTRPSKTKGGMDTDDDDDMYEPPPRHVPVGDGKIEQW